jgi:polar amino acid transport system substrate-binding protein
MGAIVRALLVLAAACVATGSLARPLGAVRASGVLSVGVYRDYKPWSWEDKDGALKGIDVDIGAALAKALGVQVDYLLVRPDDTINDDLRNAVWKGTVVGGKPADVMLHVPNDSQIEMDNDRVKLTAPYQMEGLALAVDPAKAEAAKDFSLFEHEKVAVDMQTLSDIILLSERDHKLIPNVVHVHGETNAAKAFNDGEVVAFYGEAAMVESLAHHASRPVTIVYPRSRMAKSWAVGGAVKVDSIDLADAIDTAIAEMSKSGELKRIFASYGVSWRPPPQEN